jgi:threonine dehydratase
VFRGGFRGLTDSQSAGACEILFLENLLIAPRVWKYAGSANIDLEDMSTKSLVIERLQSPITLDDVVAARERVRGSIYYSPCPHSQVLSGLTGQQIYLKLENLQMTGSFKERGALNRIAMLRPEQAARGVVAASAGNHAQGVAYHATKREIRALIVMPLATPLVKVTATRGFGAEVVLHGANYDEACTEAMRLCEAEGMTFIHPFDDAMVMAGQGTIGLEILEQVDGLEAVVVPIGGGGLIGGIACAIKESRPSVKVIGVQTSRLASMVAARVAGHPVTIEP